MKELSANTTLNGIGFEFKPQTTYDIPIMGFLKHMDMDIVSDIFLFI